MGQETMVAELLSGAASKAAARALEAAGLLSKSAAKAAAGTAAQPRGSEVAAARVAIAVSHPWPDPRCHLPSRPALSLSLRHIPATRGSRTHLLLSSARPLRCVGIFAAQSEIP